MAVATQAQRQAARETVELVMMKWMRENGIRGFEDRAAVYRQYPDVPPAIRLSAIGRFNRERSDAWLDRLANTIEGEIVTRAITRSDR